MLLPVDMVVAITLIGCVYLVLALRYWFRVPAVGIVIACFWAAWVMRAGPKTPLLSPRFPAI